jgi:hypothetical protein
MGKQKATGFSSNFPIESFLLMALLNVRQKKSIHEKVFQTEFPHEATNKKLLRKKFNNKQFINFRQLLQKLGSGKITSALRGKIQLFPKTQ